MKDTPQIPVLLQPNSLRWEEQLYMFKKKKTNETQTT